MTPEEIKAYGEELAAWAESDDFFDALETATVRIKGQDEMPVAEEIQTALKIGRPKAGVSEQGSSPTVQFRVPADLAALLELRVQQENKSKSEIAREALTQYLLSA